MKKFLKSLLCLVLLSLNLFGCSQGNSIKKIGVIQLVEHTSLNTIKNSFDKQMISLGYIDGENIEFVFRNAQGDTSVVPSIIQDFKSKKVDVIMAISTPVAMSAASVSKDIPIVFSAVSDPIGAKLVTDLNKPDKNMTGTSDEIQVELILDKALQINPNLKRLGVIYNKGEANSVTNINKAKVFASKHNIEIVETTITSVNEVQSAIQVLASKCDAVFAPNDNTIASAMNIVSNTCIKAKVPLYVGADSMVLDGGFLSVGINYEDLGKETANIVDEILKGTNIKDIPVKVFKDNLNIYVNEKVLNELDIVLPDVIINDESYKLIK